MLSIVLYHYPRATIHSYEHLVTAFSTLHDFVLSFSFKSNNKLRNVLSLSTDSRLRLPLICAEKCGWFNNKLYKGKSIKSDDDVCGCTRCSQIGRRPRLNRGTIPGSLLRSKLIVIVLLNTSCNTQSSILKGTC